jgi:Domain of unknown function (DUF5753)/Helix-turn-helix domain
MISEVRTVSTPREELARLLRESRLSAGYASHAALAGHLNVSRPVISRAENPAHPPPVDALLVSWAMATGADLNELNELATRARGGSPDWFMNYLIAEGAAHTLRCWGPVLVPGLLQTESYARAVLAVERYGSARLEELVTARMERQQVIGRAVVTAILDERVTNRLIGSPLIMSEQCAHLAIVGERPDVAVHVLPEASNLGTWGALDIATRDSTVTVCLTTLEDVTSTAEHLTIKATHAFDSLLGAAMPVAESLELIRRREQEWKSKI